MSLLLELDNFTQMHYSFFSTENYYKSWTLAPIAMAHLTSHLSFSLPIPKHVLVWSSISQFSTSHLTFIKKNVDRTFSFCGIQHFVICQIQLLSNSCHLCSYCSPLSLWCIVVLKWDVMKITKSLIFSCKNSIIKC